MKTQVLQTKQDYLEIIIKRLLALNWKDYRYSFLGGRKREKKEKK